MRETIFQTYELLLALDASGPVQRSIALESGTSAPPVMVYRIPREIAAQQEFLRLFHGYAKRATLLDHEHLAATLRADVHADSYFVVEQLAHGESLERLLGALRARGQRLPLVTSLSIISKLAQALHAAHTLRDGQGRSRGILHGDLDPGKVFLSYDGRVELVGLAVGTASRHVQQSTQGVLSPAQLHYTSPEECLGQKPGIPSNIFTLGVLLWEMLTGQPLYESRDSFELMNAICERAALPPSRLNKEVPPFLDALVLKTLAKEPEQRIEDCKQLSMALENVIRRLQQGPVSLQLELLLIEMFPDRAQLWQALQQATRSINILQIERHLRALFLGESPQDNIRSTAEMSAVHDPFAGDQDPWGDLAGMLDEALSGAALEPETRPAQPAMSAAPKRAPMREAAPTMPLRDLDGPPTREVLFDALDVDAASIHQEATRELPRPEPTPVVDWGDVVAQLPAQHEAPYAPQPAPSEPWPKAKAKAEPGAALATQPKPEPEPKPEPAPKAALFGAAASPPAQNPSEPQARREPSSPQVRHVEPTERVEPLSPERRGAPQAPRRLADPTSPEDDDELFAQVFALHELTGEDRLDPARRIASPEALAIEPVLEILRIRDGLITEVVTLKGARRSYQPSGGALKIKRQGKKVSVSGPAAGLLGWSSPKNAPGQHPIAPGQAALELAPGDAAQLQDGQFLYQLKFFFPPLPPAKLPMQQPAKVAVGYVIALGIALVCHGAIGLMFLFIGERVPLALEAKPPDEIFAEGKLKDIEKPKPDEPEKPKPKPKPKPIKLTQKPPSDPTEANAKVPKSVRKALDKRLKVGASKINPKASKADQLTAALSSPVQGDGQTIKDVVTNLDAVKPKDGSSGAFRVAGTIAAIEGDAPNIGRGGGGKIGDLSAGVADGVGKLEKRKDSGSGKVRGQVRAVSALASVQGSISRGEVMAEINKHVGKIQMCYERELNKKPQLAGKINFEWTIQSSGKVSNVKEKSSTLNDAAVSNCIKGIIGKMVFPKPKGGDVVIVFPFVFNSSN